MPRHSQTSLSDIPTELLLEILGFLDPKTLLLSSSVSHLWHQIVKESPALQYTIELWADGMSRGESGGLTSAEALAVLYGYRRAWSAVDWTSKSVVEIEALVFCRAYEFVGGIFAQQQRGGDFLTISVANIGKDPTTARATRVIGPNIEDFAIDPTQDLLARYNATPGIVARLELCTISSQQPHPLAAQPHIDISADELPPLSIQIADDAIGIFFLDSIRFVLLNWRSGIILTDVDLLDIEDFHFLSPRSYILVHAYDDGLVEVVTFDGLRPNSSTRVATLLLPELTIKAYISSAAIHAGAFLTKAPSGTAPFSKSNNNRIYMFHINYSLSDWFHLFVHGRFFQQFVVDYMRDKTVKLNVPWDDWGPQSSRMLRGAAHEGTRQVHGERVALPCKSPSSVQVLDFGIIPRHAVDTVPPSSTQSEIELHMEPSSLEVTNIFSGPVTTALPYSSTIRSLEGEEHNMFLIDEDRLIGINLDDAAPSHQMTVYTF
ncbi:hypothetical protein DFH06DRAFT_1081558 [Mycena polygramma]|nr:hypothetical protein DFH06DRAFT_1081558 [Mycena polygramma]